MGTRRDPQGELIEKPDSNKAESADKLDPSSIKNLGFIKNKWTEILIEDSTDVVNNRSDVKKEIDMLKRNQDKPINEFADDLIRVNRRTYARVEVNNYRNKRTNSPEWLA